MIPRQTSTWDDRRNTSQVFPVEPGALREAFRALASLRERDPALVRWIEDGHPNLTQEEHVQRFGEPFKTRPRRQTVRP